MAFLDIGNLSAFYGKKQVLFDVNLTVKRGQICTLLGANGAGKTTLMQSILGLVKKTGQIHLNAKDVSHLPSYLIARMGVAFVPDTRGTFMDLSVLENLQLGAYNLKNKKEVARNLEQIYHYFPFLTKRLNQQAGTLSGGEQQMLAISRCLLMNPQLIILDEPSLGLAPLIVRDIFQIMTKICKEKEITILLAEQNAAIALQTADYVYLIETGKIILSGTSQMFKDNKSIQRAYLGVA